MSQQYTHRNGETEPPTVAGLYWLKWGGRKKIFLAMPIVYVMISKTGEVSVIDDDNELVDMREYRYRWWGPVSPPWVNE